jgi:hypothetical protein
MGILHEIEIFDRTDVRLAQLESQIRVLSKPDNNIKNELTAILNALKDVERMKPDDKRIAGKIEFVGDLLRLYQRRICPRNAAQENSNNCQGGTNAKFSFSGGKVRNYRG